MLPAGPDPLRRRVLATLGASAACALPGVAAGEIPTPNTRSIPSTGERLPSIGVGSWITFNVGSARADRAPLVPVLQTFFDRDGRLIDSSPMYGTSEAVIGDLLSKTSNHARLFSATKIWTYGKAAGARQLETSRELWGVQQFDLVQIHNMLHWEAHLETLKEQKAAGKVRYIGITTSHGRLHDDMVKALTRERFDFVQLTYNFADRSVEQRLLPLAAERNIAVIVNRPFDGGDLFAVVKGRPVPGWAREFDCENWAQFFLKFVVSQPAVTCAIPATSQSAHMAQNMGALYGRLPDGEVRKRMARHMETL
jgi:diketogulonate reductase-like aldo/keto reductase